MKFHEAFNADDGDIILRSTGRKVDGDDGPEHIHFEVTKAVLSWQSDIFKTMFTLRQTPNNSECVDEVAIVDLQDDPDALASLLRALYYPEYVLPGGSYYDVSKACTTLQISPRDPIAPQDIRFLGADSSLGRQIHHDAIGKRYLEAFERTVAYYA